MELALALGKERSVLRAQQGARDGLRARALQKGTAAQLPEPLRDEVGRTTASSPIPTTSWPATYGVWDWKVRPSGASPNI